MLRTSTSRSSLQNKILVNPDAWGVIWCSSSSQKRSGFRAGHSRSSTPTLVNHVFMKLASCTGASSCWSRNGFLLVPGKGNCRPPAYEHIVYNRVLPTLKKGTQMALDGRVSTHHLFYSSIVQPSASEGTVMFISFITKMNNKTVTWEILQNIAPFCSPFGRNVRCC